MRRTAPDPLSPPRGSGDPTASADNSARTPLGSAYALMAFGMFTIPVMDVIAKGLIMGGMPEVQVALARFISQAAFTLAIPAK